MINKFLLVHLVFFTLSFVHADKIIIATTYMSTNRILHMNEVDIHKHKLADTLAPLISIEGLTDVTDWIEKNGGQVGDIGCTHNGVARSVAYILEATGDFQCEELLDKSRYYVKRLPKRSLEQKYPTWFKLGLVILGAGLTLLGNFAKKQSTPPPVYRIEDSRSGGLYDSVTNIRKELKAIQDKLAKYK